MKNEELVYCPDIPEGVILGMKHKGKDYIVVGTEKKEEQPGVDLIDLMIKVENEYKKENAPTAATVRTGM